jgi:competence protein ComEC
MAELSDTGYGEAFSVSIENGEFLFNDGPSDFRPFPAGSGVPDHRMFANLLSQACELIADSDDVVDEVALRLSRLPNPDHIEVFDVGQASFIAARDASNVPLVYFDVGWPLFFNKRTAPKHFVAPKVGYIILSHWDFDHLLCYYRFRHLRRATWIVPAQRMGPGARKIASALAHEGNLVVVDRPVDFGWGKISKSSGPLNNANNSGLVAWTRLRSGKSVLLVGDANYDSLTLSLSTPPHFMVATHHGGIFAGSVPAPFHPESRCVISVGKDNVYGHPKEEAVKAHQSAGWKVSFTHFEGNVGIRGPRRLGP